MSDTTQSAGVVSRRELLGRGVKLGGAVLWMTPVVQSVGMGRAFAAPTSGNCVLYCVKYEVDEASWEPLGSERAKGNCFVCPDDAMDALPRNFSARVERGDGGTLHVELPAGCTVWGSVGETGSVDEFTGDYTIAVKCGSQQVRGRSFDDDDSACHMQTVDDPSEFAVHPCSNGKSISHFEFLLKCCP